MIPGVILFLPERRAIDAFVEVIRDRLPLFIPGGANRVPAPNVARLASPCSIRLNDGHPSAAAVVFEFGLLLRFRLVADPDQPVFRVSPIGALFIRDTVALVVVLVQGLLNLVARAVVICPDAVRGGDIVQVFRRIKRVSVLLPVVPPGGLQAVDLVVFVVPLAALAFQGFGDARDLARVRGVGIAARGGRMADALELLVASVRFKSVAARDRRAGQLCLRHLARLAQIVILELAHRAVAIRHEPAHRTITLKLEANNHAGVTPHVVGLFSRRAYNVEGNLVCMPVGDGCLSRIWLTVNEEARLEQMILQIEKLEDVLDVRRHGASHEVFGQVEKFFQ